MIRSIELTGKRSVRVYEVDVLFDAAGLVTVRLASGARCEPRGRREARPKRCYAL